MFKTQCKEDRVDKDSGDTKVVRVNQSMLDVFNAEVEANPSVDLSAELIHFANENPVKRARLLRKPDSTGDQCSRASG